MPTFTNANYDQFYSVSRGAELVILKDRDVMAFWADTVSKDATSGMQMYRDGTQTFIQYGSSPLQTVSRSQRVLLWCRMSGRDVVTGPRWVPYVNDNDPGAVDIRPLREVFDPRVTFDSASNTLHLWFWTNVNAAYDGIQYDENLLYPVGCQGYDTIILNKSAKRVLCYAIGSLYHVYVKGGFVTGFQGMQGTGFQSNTWDLVPVFTRPKMVNFHVSTSPVMPAAGIMTDGWYPGGAGGYRVQVSGLLATAPNGRKIYYGNAYEGLQGFDGIPTETNVRIVVGQLALSELVPTGFQSATASKKTAVLYFPTGAYTGTVYEVDVPRLV